MLKRHGYHVIALILSLVITRGYLLHSGYIYLAEQFEVYTVDGLWHVVYPVWCDRVQSPALADVVKIYLYTPFIVIAKVFNSYKLLQFLLLATPHYLSFVSAFKLARYVVSRVYNLPEKYVLLSAYISAFVFSVNPWFAICPRNITMRFQYSALPIVVYAFIRLLETNRLRYFLFFVLVMAVLSGYRYTTIVMLMLLAILLVFIINSLPKIKICLFMLVKVFIAYVFVIALSLAKFLPGIVYSKASSVMWAAHFTHSMIKRESILHIFTTKIYEWTAVPFEMTYNDLTHFLFVFVTIFGFTYCTFYYLTRKNQNITLNIYTKLPLFIFTFFIILSAKELNLDDFILRLPFSSFIGRVLRQIDSIDSGSLHCHYDGSRSGVISVFPQVQPLPDAQHQLAVPNR